MKTIECDNCHQEWHIHYLCPECWAKFLEHINEDSRCYKCGSEYYEKALELPDGDIILGIYCPVCKDYYVPIE